MSYLGKQSLMLVVPVGIAVALVYLACMPSPKGSALSSTSLATLEGILESASDPPRHGEEQTQSMVRDRPLMGEIVRPGDTIWCWLVDHFDGEGTGFPVFWSAQDPDGPFFSTCTCPRVDARAEIRVRDIGNRLNGTATAATSYESERSKLRGERLLASAVFELLNLEGCSDYLCAHDQALRGELVAQDWVETCTRLEHIACLRQKAFFQRVWSDWASQKGTPATPHVWKMEVPDSYDEWSASFSRSKEDYPWVPFGRYFEEQLAPYLSRGLAVGRNR